MRAYVTICDMVMSDVTKELLTKNGAVFKNVQNTLNIKWRRLLVALGLFFLVDSLVRY